MGGTMIGRIEISEILGMAGTCAAVLIAGFSVETLGELPAPDSNVAGIHAPAIPVPIDLLEELRLETPHVARPLPPAPPVVTPCALPIRKRFPTL
jgi:hypothetical protein